MKLPDIFVLQRHHFFLKISICHFTVVSTFVTNKQLRETVHFCFNLKESAVERHRLLCEAYGEHAPSIKTSEHWFRRIKNCDFITSYKELDGRPVKFEDIDLEALLDQDSRHTLKELAEPSKLLKKRCQPVSRPWIYGAKTRKLVCIWTQAKRHRTTLF